MRTKSVLLLCLLAASSAAGCAPWRGAGSGIMERVASAFGEQSPEALAAQRAQRAESVKLVARQAPPPQGDDAEPAPYASTSGVKQAAATEPAAVTPAVFDRCCDACESCEGCESTCRTCPLCPLEACGRCAACLRGHRCKLFTRPQPGPPPVNYVPALPPKFLPVPTQPTLSPARPEAPDAWRGDLEFGWRSEITSPGRD
jgi:hypothetical protein